MEILRPLNDLPKKFAKINKARTMELTKCLV